MKLRDTIADLLARRQRETEILRTARAVLNDIDIDEDIEYPPTIMVDTYPGQAVVTLKVALLLGSSVTWRAAMQRVHFWRRALGITRVSRHAGAMSTYHGEVVRDGITYNLYVYAHQLPPTCRVEYEEETRTLRVPKMVCA